MWNSRRQRAFQALAPVFGLLLTTLGVRSETITWSEHIAPIVYNNCTVCHREGGVAPFPLLSYDDAKDRAEQIAEVVENRMMPPWKPDSVHSVPLREDRSLSDKEVSLILEWAREGSRQGSSRRTPKPPQFADSWQLGEPELVLQLNDPISVPPEGSDLYRNFVIPTGIAETKYVRAVEVLPESKQVVRQVVMSVDESDWARRNEASDVEPGFDGLNVGKTLQSTGQFVGWTPGRAPYLFDEGGSWEIQANSDLFVQLHISPTGNDEVVNPKIGLYFTDQAPANTPDYLFLHSRSLDDSMGEASPVVEERLSIPVDVSVSGLIPFARSFVSGIEVAAEMINGQKKVLLQIPDWDSNWQRDYRFEEPVVIPAGSELVMRSTLDSFPDELPKDGLAQTIVQLVLGNSADKDAIRKAQVDYEIKRAGGMAGYYHDNGADLERLGRIDEAISAFEQAAQEDPSNGEVRNSLGVIYEEQGNKTQAEYYFRDAIEADGSLRIARLNLGRFLRKSKRQQAAAKALQEAIDQDPEFLLARLELSALFAEQKLFKLAIQMLEDGLKLDPLEPYLNLQTGKLYVMDQRLDDSIKYFEAAAQGKQENLKYDVGLDYVLVQANWIPARMSEAAGNIERMNYYLDRVFEIDPAYLEGRLLLVNKLLEGRQEIEARKHLEFLLKLPLDKQPTPPALIAELSFPQGIRLLADVYKRTQRSEIGKGILAEALLVAEKKGNRIWITQLQNDLARYR